MIYLNFLISIQIISFIYSEKVERVHMKDVQTLTLKKGELSTSKRVSPILQLKCVGGSAGCKYQPETVQCYNRGIDGKDIQWECKAELPSRLNFGYMKVSCEGYDNSKDEYILYGSCGLEYKLEDLNASSGVSVEAFIFFLIILTFVVFLIMRDSTTRDSMLLPTTANSNHVYLNNNSYSRGHSYSIPSFKLKSGFSFTSIR